MKKIYIVLTHTGTVLSRIIKVYTKNEFSHVSISLDKNLDKMYSFGRLNPYNPFIGGFIHEHIDKGTFYRFKKTKTTIYSLDISDKQYKKLEDLILKFETNKKKYTFNIIGLFAVAVKLKIKINRSFYCAEFVKYILDESDIKTELPDIIKPEDFKYLQKTTEIYNGVLKEYKCSEKNLI